MCIYAQYLLLITLPGKLYLVHANHILVLQIHHLLYQVRHWQGLQGIHQEAQEREQESPDR